MFPAVTEFSFADWVQAFGTLAVLLYLAPHALKLAERWRRPVQWAAIAAFVLAFAAALWGAARYFLEF